MKGKRTYAPESTVFRRRRVHVVCGFPRRRVISSLTARAARFAFPRRFDFADSTKKREARAAESAVVGGSIPSRRPPRKATETDTGGSIATLLTRQKRLD